MGPRTQPLIGFFDSAFASLRNAATPLRMTREDDVYNPQRADISAHSASVAWLACVVYATIPLFWLDHPPARRTTGARGRVRHIAS